MHNISICCSFSPARRGRCCPSGMSHGFLKEASTCVIEAFGDIDFQHILRPVPNRVKDRFNRIEAGASWAKAIGMRRQLGFPCWLQGLAHEGLPCPIPLGGNPERTLFLAAWFGNPRAS